MIDKAKTADRRVTRTITSLRTALIELILEKHYDSITVQDIIDRANVGRATFYSHFRDKEDLLIGDWKRLLGMISANIDLDQSSGGRLAPIEGLMTHLREFHPFYRALVKSGKAERFFDLGTEFLAKKIEEKIAASAKKGLTVPPAFMAHYLALQFFGTLQWWLDQNMPYSPAEMDKMFHDLVAPGVANCLGKGPAGNENRPRTATAEHPVFRPSK